MHAITKPLRKLMVSACLPLAVAMVLVTPPALASDHTDTPLLTQVMRNDARLTDFYAFSRGENLVLVMGIDPAVVPGVSDYTFPTDVTYRFHIDNNSKVRFNDAEDLASYGGTIPRPGKIREDLTFEVSFDAQNRPQVDVRGLHKQERRTLLDRVQVFTGLRDDPFIVKPRIGRNVAAIVLELPLYAVSDNQAEHGDDNSEDNGSGVLLMWVTADLDSISGKQVESIGRAFRSTFADTDLMNTLHPRLHYSELGLVPDVMIYDTNRPAAYPNGRELMDDVATIIADPRIVRIDTPSPDTNDVPFLDQFPYLAAPQ